jgi:hypothetical protein
VGEVNRAEQHALEEENAALRAELASLKERHDALSKEYTIERALRVEKRPTDDELALLQSVGGTAKEAKELLDACWHGSRWSDAVADDWSYGHLTRMVAWHIRSWRCAVISKRYAPRRQK